MPLSVSAVGPGQALAVWNHVLPMVRRGLKHGAGDSTSEQEIISSVLSGQMTMWAVHDGDEITATVILQAIPRSKGTALLVVLVAGRDFKTWGERVQSLIQDYSELIGAYTIEAVARDGMAKWLKEMGWRRKATIMELGNGR